MNLDEVPKTMAMFSELQRNKAALEHLDQGGKIVAIQISMAPPEAQEGQPPTPPPQVMVSAFEMNFTAQTIEGIKRAIGHRQVTLEKELGELGVSGL
jgi:hypothetical protein